MDTDGIKIEDFMDVLFKCKFCSYTCTDSPNMGLHVRDKHLPSTQTQSQCIGNIQNEADDVSATVCNSTVSTSSTTSTISGSRRNPTNISGSSSSSNFTIQESEDVLGFTTDGNAFLDKVSFAPLAVPVSQGGPINLSNTSTPDLTELINLVKPTEHSIGNNVSGHLLTNHSHLAATGPGHFNTGTNHLSVSVCNGDQFPASENPLALPSVVQLQPGPGSGSALPPSFNEATVVSADLDGLNNSQPYTVMAIHLPNLAVSGSNTVPQYVVSTPVSEPINIPEHTETKEFLLCGLCKLAFSTMEECQAHMQSEHKELMQGSGVSIGVQVGGAKRGRKRKSELPNKIKQEPSVDPEDLEWLPSVSDKARSSHPDGRVRRKVKPPRALKEDYVLGKRLRKRLRETCVNLGYKIVCPMMSCKAKFKTEEGLHIHMSCHNLEDTAFTCKECQAPHEFWKNLRIHLWRQHKVDCDLFSCDKCDYKTDTHHKMNIHKEIHADAKPYTCDVCGKGFRQASQMKNHQVIHSNQEGKETGKGWFYSKTCDICDRVFANSKCLKKHKEAVHTDYKPFECLYCSHTTARKAMMELHIRTHTGDKPFKCDICQYSTGDHNSLRRHKMRHTGQKQYRCTQCPYTCIQSISLKQHMRHKHPGTSAGIFQCARCPFRTINQAIYSNHMKDHKKGLIPDKIIPPRLELPKAKKIPHRSQTESAKGQASGQTVVEPLLIKHPQFHAVLPGDEPTTLTNVCGDAISGVNSGGGEIQAEVFNMQVTVLAEGDTQISADDMTRLSESPGLMATGVTPLQLIYATLQTISEQGEVARVGEGRSSLLTTELIGGIHTAVLSSMQDGVTVHSITYHLPKLGTSNNVEEGQGQLIQVLDKGDDGQGEATKSVNDNQGEEEVNEHMCKVEVIDRVLEQEILPVIEGGRKAEEILFLKDIDGKIANVVAATEEKEICLEDSQLKDKNEKIVGSSALRQMLESQDKMAVLNTESSDVRLITVDFLDSSMADVSSSQTFGSSSDIESCTQ